MSASDKENADRAFEIIGIYFANRYWTSHFKTALDEVKNGNMFDIVESYKVTIERYNRAFGRKENKDEPVNPQYLRVIADLKEYYEKQINIMASLEGGMSVRFSDRDFVDTMSKYLLSKGEYERIGKYDARKEGVFRIIMTQTVAKFTMFVIRSCVHDVTDQNVRSDLETTRKFVRNWCNEFKTILSDARDEFCNFILAHRSGIDISREKIESVPKLVVDRLQEEMQILLNEKADLTRMVNNYADFATKLKSLLEKEQKRNRKLEKALRQAVSTVPTVPTVTPAKPTVTPAPAKPAPAAPTEIIGNGIVKEKAAEPVLDAMEELQEAEFSGEDFIKPPDDGKYLEEVGSRKSQRKPSSSEETESYDTDDVLESFSDTLGSDDELSADD